MPPLAIKATSYTRSFGKIAAVVALYLTLALAALYVVVGMWGL
jgi:hypothetical protein